MPDRLPVPQQEISNGIAQLYKTRMGRGPTKVSTTIVGDVVVCVLEDTDTPFEETLLDLGARDLVQQARSRFQLQCTPELVVIVEQATGRKVRVHVPGYRASSDVATEVFLLESEG
ncbi:Na-translocating system protein MpsC family protein [Patulibacter sp. NPDC049589]|uniref:Na-translocating system protein MpsC family protein n=1 Tax=Patulibacter sp. NPDC049589 TaxID=3154731 RepID=UPI0034344535